MYMYFVYYLAFISILAVVVLDIDDCASFPCGFDNDCFDKVNGYDCSCATGYALDNTNRRCIGLTRAAHNQTAKLCRVISVSVSIHCRTNENTGINARDQYQRRFYTASPTIRGPSPKIFTLGKIWADFTKLPTLIANIS